MVYVPAINHGISIVEKVETVKTQISSNDVKVISSLKILSLTL